MIDGAATRDEAMRRAAGGRDVRLLVADDDEPVRLLLVTLLKEVDGVGSIVAAADGAEAVQLAKTLALDIAVLDLDMPRLDGVAAALELAALQPTLAIALQTSDPDALRRRACGLDFPLFDKIDFDRVVAWVAGEIAGLSRAATLLPRAGRDLSCARCGYGVATDAPPQRCPMCGSVSEWTADRTRARAVG